MPKAREIFSLFLDLSPDERLAFAEVAAEDGRVEADEADFLLLHLPRHVIELSDALADVLSLRDLNIIQQRMGVKMVDLPPADYSALDRPEVSLRIFYPRPESRPFSTSGAKEISHSG